MYRILGSEYGLALMSACIESLRLQFAEISNLKTHLILSSLRSDGSKGRSIPYGYGFSLVSFPNYFFEMLGWLTIVVMTGSWAGKPNSFLSLAAFLQAFVSNPISCRWHLHHGKVGANEARKVQERFWRQVSEKQEGYDSILVLEILWESCFLYPCSKYRTARRVTVRMCVDRSPSRVTLFKVIFIMSRQVKSNVPSTTYSNRRIVVQST